MSKDFRKHLKKMASKKEVFILNWCFFNIFDPKKEQKTDLSNQ